MTGGYSRTTDRTLEERFDLLESKLKDPDFLSSNGLANEASIYIFPYDPARELDVRAWAQRVSEQSEKGDLPCRLICRDLWDVFTTFLEQKLGTNWFKKVCDLEAKRGSEALFDRFTKMANARTLAELMDWPDHTPGQDVLLISGVGRAYPFVRLHGILEACQPLYDDVPLVALYPGVYTGQELRLFGKLADGNYYRAFKAV